MNKEEHLQLFRTPPSKGDKINWFYQRSVKFIKDKTKEHKDKNISIPVWEWAYNIEHDKI